MAIKLINVLVLIFIINIVNALPQKKDAEPSAKSGATTARPIISDQELEKALMDKRYLNRQIKCALGEAPCDPVGRRLKSLAPFVLRGACPQCTPMETRQIQKTLAYIQKNFPQQWNKLVQAYSG